jgi:RNA polymerase sigma-70 factor (ECF subfamily)
MVTTEQQTHESSSSDRSFRTTLWGVVLEAGKGGSERSSTALERLCQAYWYPLYVFVRRQGHGPEDAQDLVQEFFARVLDRNYFRAADPEKGRFRFFLIAAMRHFLAKEWDRAHCQKRGGGSQFLPFEDENPETRYLAEAPHHLSAEKAYARRWALTLLDQTLEKLKAEYSAAGRAELFSELVVFLNGEQSPGASAEICQRLGMREGTLRVTVHRLRQRYRELLRLEISRTVENPADIDDEIRHLFDALS